MKEEQFRKLTKKQKLEMEMLGYDTEIECTKVLFIPIKRKNDGYGMSACFLDTKDGWVRAMDYDCFRFIEGNFIKGDFEYGGVVFFGGNRNGKGFKYSYGNEFKCN